jgi:hypothetical protein
MRPPIVSAVDCVSYLSANRTKPRAFFAAIEITEVAMRDADAVLTRRKRERLCDFCAMLRCVATSLREGGLSLRTRVEICRRSEKNQTRQRLKVADKFSKER